MELIFSILCVLWRNCSDKGTSENLLETLTGASEYSQRDTTPYPWGIEDKLDMSLSLGKPSPETNELRISRTRLHVGLND